MNPAIAFAIGLMFGYVIGALYGYYVGRMDDNGSGVVASDGAEK